MSIADWFVFVAFGTSGGAALMGVVYLVTRVSRNPYTRCALAVAALAACYLVLSLTLGALQ